MRLSSIRLIQNLPKPGKIVRVSLLFVSTFILIFAFVPWQQNALGNGRVIAYSPTERHYQLHSPISGRIFQWYVNEGDIVKKGEPIVLIKDIDPQYLNRLQAQKKVILLQIKASKEALNAAESNENRQYKLYQEGINSRKDFEMASITKTKQQLEVAKAEIDKMKIENLIARQSSQAIKAPSDGIIYRRLTGQEGIIVKKGAMVAEILPKTSSRAAEIFIDGNDIPFVQLHQKARLEFEGWPAVQTPGWPEIAIGTFGGTVAFIDPTDNGQGMFRVVIVPSEKWPGQNFLRQGVKAHGWVQLGQVPIWFEIWRQMNGYPPVSAEIKL